MSVIGLEGMRFFAYHGVYEEEQILGGEYIVDVFIQTNTGAAATTDDINKTVNYETIYSICDFEMRKPSDLIENVIERIMYRIKATFQVLQEVTIKVNKLNPPLGGRVAKASIETSAEFVSRCGRCGRGMVCYGDETCWCNEAKTLHPRTVELVESEHGSCVCNNCLNFYAG
jgi:dihydroneopterin aldolase